ncbi:MAG: site-specific integrase [Defluviitaleaceae bacterium]|nr:site-specific integrase [Defluviitaleaceae bacterium]
MPKRTNGEGTIYQRPDGLWRSEITLGYDANGKRIKKVFTSKSLETLHKKINDEKFRLNRNVITQNSNYTVAEWVQFWLENYKANTLKSKTYDSYEYSLNKHIRDSIGNLKLNKIRPDSIQQLYNQMHKRNLSASTIRITHITLSQAFEQAIKNELIHANPCKATVRPKSEKKKITALTVEQQKMLIQHCNESVYHNLFIFLLNTGMRVGESTALLWEDVNFEEKTIEISKTVSDIVNRDEEATTKRKTIIDTAKTAHSIRTIPMNDTSMKVLNRQKEKNNSIFIFSSKSETILAYRNIGRAFNELLKNCNLSDSITVHTLRHTFATRLLEKGVNPKVVSDLLGHASVQITLDVYSHVMPNIKSDAVNLLD